MGVIKFDRDFETLFNWDTDENPTTEQDYQNAVKNWTETEMNIVDTLLWQPTTEYATGNIVKTPSLPSQYVLRCAEAGTSGSTEPSYSGASVGDTVTDGSVEWVIVSLATGNAADVDAGNIGVNAEVDNSEAWGNAIGGGAIAEDDERLVKGDTVYAVTSVMETNIATNTEAIEDNTENIATNTENIAQNTTDIDIAEKRIGNIEKLLQGNLYDYQTDTDSKYTKTVPQGAMPYASLDSIGGKTLVWNQLANAIDSTHWSVWAGGQATVSFADGVATVTVVDATKSTYQYSLILQSGYNYTVVNGHKYLYSYEVKTNTAGVSFRNRSVINYSSDGTVATANTWERKTAIVTATATSTNSFFVYPNDNLENLVYDIKNAMVVDLTLMYGSGNEPSTVAEFQAQFPAPYYAFNEGTLLLAGVTEVKSVGINIWDEQWELGGINLTTGVKDSATDRIRSKNYIPVKANVPYFFNNLPATENMVVLCYTYDKTYTGTYYYRNVNQPAQTLPQGTAFILFYMVMAYGTTYRNDICIHVNSASTNGKYYPYNAHTYPIPAEIQALEGYGWSAGTAYNYIDYEAKKFVQNVGKVVLDGTQTSITNVNWRANENGVGWIYPYSVAPCKIPLTANSKANLICAELPTNAYNNLYVQQVGVGVYVDNSRSIVIWQSNTSLTTSSAINTYLSANPITVYYELATPVEIDISAYITDDNLIEVESGGSLTFPNSNGTDYQIPVPSAETYMVDLQSAI